MQIEVHVLGPKGKLEERHKINPGTLALDGIGMFRIEDHGDQVWVELIPKRLRVRQGVVPINWGSVYTRERGYIAKSADWEVMVAVDPKPKLVDSLPLSSGPLRLALRRTG